MAKFENKIEFEILDQNLENGGLNNNKEVCSNLMNLKKILIQTENYLINTDKEYVPQWIIKSANFDSYILKDESFIACQNLCAQFSSQNIQIENLREKMCNFFRTNFKLIYYYYYYNLIF